MAVCCLSSENSFVLAMGRVLRALRELDICAVILPSSRSIAIELAGSAENGCIDCDGKASCEPNSWTTDKMVRVC